MNKKISVAKFPFVFWFMQEAQASEISEQIVINAKAYQYKEFARKKFLALKYAIPLLFVFFVVNRYDFFISLERIAEWFLGLALLVTYKKETFLAFVVVLICFACFVFMTPAVAAFSVKYFLIVLLAKNIILDYRQTQCFALYDRNKLLSHFTLKTENVERTPKKARQ